MLIENLAIVGVGLIGGSIGLAAKRRGVTRRVVGISRSEQNLAKALALGAIDVAFQDLESGVRQADFIVFCTPVDRIAGQVLEAAPFCPRAALLTDVGSTKGAIVSAVEAALSHDVFFVGSHPLAGSEKQGPQYGSAALFEDKVTVVTRTARTDANAFERTAAFWCGLGARVRTMDPNDHDRALALTSHLPHVVASALATMLPFELRDLTAAGFRDGTRVAAGDPSLWTAIFSQNRPRILDALTQYEDVLASFRKALLSGEPDAIAQLLTQAKKVRDGLGS